jgi:hypothetical protein
MNLKTVDRETYDRVTAMVPEHDARVIEWRRSGRLYYVRQEVYDPDGGLVAVHDETGAFLVNEAG